MTVGGDNLVVSAFSNVDKAARHWRLTGDEAALREVEQGAQKELERLQQITLDGYVQGRADLESNPELLKARLERIANRLAAIYVLQIREKLISKVGEERAKQIDLKEEFLLAKGKIKATFEREMSGYSTDRATALETSINAREKGANTQVVEDTVNNVLKEIIPVIAPFIEIAKKKDLQSGGVFQAVAEEIYEKNKVGLETSEVVQALSGNLPPALANQAVKESLIAAIVKKLKAIPVEQR